MSFDIPLWPREGAKRNICWEPKADLINLFDHLIDAGEQRRWHGEAECLCTFENRNLDEELCRQRAAECRRLAGETKSPSVQIMLDHIAETWLPIVRNLTD